MSPHVFLSSSRLPLLLGLTITLLTTLIYGQSYDFRFINWDDNAYVYGDPLLMGGLTWAGLENAFTNITPYIMPLTRIVYMVEAQLFGEYGAGGFHLVNAFIHLLNALLLFHLFQRMTGALWSSGLLALLFAVHPMHVEAVAWVMELKEVLSLFFGLLAMEQYVTYVQLKERGEQETLQFHYLLMILFYIGSLMAKPMWVTLPFLLLLLDWWPLNRFHRGLPELIREKLPLLFLSIFSSGVTVLNFLGMEKLADLDKMPLAIRLSNLPIAWVTYLGLTVLPLDLGMYYPHPLAADLTPWKVGGAAFILLTITVIALWQCHKRPYLITGWLWFAGSLVPVSGLVNGGEIVAMADRWSYLPHWGIFWAVIWGISAWIGENHQRRHGAALLSGLFVLWLTLLAWQQVGFWRNSEVAWSRAIAVTDPQRNHYARFMLGSYYRMIGREDKAWEHMLAAYQLKPTEPYYILSIGNMLLLQNKIDEAYTYYYKLLESPTITMELATQVGVDAILNKTYDRAIPLLEGALRLPINTHTNYLYEAHYNLGLALAALHRLAEATPHFEIYFLANPNLTARKCADVLTMFERENVREEFPGAYPFIANVCAAR